LRAPKHVKVALHQRLGYDHVPNATAIELDLVMRETSDFDPNTYFSSPPFRRIRQSIAPRATRQANLAALLGLISPWSAEFISVLLMTISSSWTAALATTYYVSPNGSNTNPGTSLSLPFETIQAAADVVNPGDTVYVLTGTYTTPTNKWNNAVVTVSTSGAAQKPITFSAYPGQHPIISSSKNPDVWDAVQIFGAYIALTGFEIVGNAQYVTLAQATKTYNAEEKAYLASVAAHKKNPSVPIVYPGDSLTNGNCVAVSSTNHIVIEGNLIHDCSAAGIDIESSDYTTVENNVVFNTSWWTVYGSSGIDFHLSANTDSTAGYRNFIINNISHDSANTQPFFAYGTNGKPTDGNGIILDNTEFSSNGQSYGGRTLVMGNIIYNNGGAGIQAYYANHVDIYDNTTVLNNRCIVPGSTCGRINNGQILVNVASDINIYNNIMLSPKGEFTYNAWDSVPLSEGHNVLFAAGGGVVLKPYITLDTSDLVQNPDFVDFAEVGQSSFSPGADLANLANPAMAAQALMLTKQSPARNNGTGILDDGDAMLVTPQAMNGNLDSGLDVGALSYPASP
jgi:parallel beta-helix repeat protein